MNRLRAVTLALLLPALLAACAPGATSGAPVRADAGPVPVARGTERLVRVDFSLADLDVAPSDLRASFWVPSGYASEVADVSAYFALHDVTVPPGWEIELSQAKLERRTATTSRTSTAAASTIYQAWAEVRVRVGEEAVPGVYRVRGTLQARGGARQQLEFRIEVAP